MAPGRCAFATNLAAAMDQHMTGVHGSALEAAADAADKATTALFNANINNNNHSDYEATEEAADCEEADADYGGPVQVSRGGATTTAAAPTMPMQPTMRSMMLHTPSPGKTVAMGDGRSVFGSGGKSDEEKVSGECHSHRRLRNIISTPSIGEFWGF